MKSLIFTGEKVRAILDGRKTQTRRVVKPQPDYFGKLDGHDDWHWNGWRWQTIKPGCPVKGPEEDAPYKPGETVYVRETWCQKIDQGVFQFKDNADMDCHYAADGTEVQAVDEDGFQRYRKDGSEASPWQSPMRMPEIAARLFLLIESVRVERLQDISEEDAKAEGITEDFPEEECNSDRPFRDGYAVIWRSIHGPESWDLNPWVWVYKFRRVER